MFPVPLWLAIPCVLLFAVLLLTLVFTLFGLIPRRYRTAFEAAGFVSIGIVYLLTCSDWVDVIGDNIAYLRDAMQILRGEPLLDRQYGVGVKAMLAGAMAVFPDNVTAWKLLTTAPVGGLVPCCSYWLLRGQVGRSRAFVLALLTGATWFVVHHSRVLTADIPFPAFSLLALVATQRYLCSERATWKAWALTSCAIGWAYFVKSPGAFIAVAATTWGLFHGRTRRGLSLLGGTALCVVPNLAYMVVAHPDRVGYLSSMVDQISCGSHMPEVEIGGFWNNLLYYVTVKNPQGYLENLSEICYPFWAIGAALPFDVLAIGWVTLALVLIGCGWGKLRGARSPMDVLRRLEVYELFAGAYLATLFLLPGSPIRYVIPILPLVYLYLLDGLEIVLTLLAGPGSKRYGLAVFAILFFGFAFQADLAIIRKHRIGPPYDLRWQRYFEAALWVRRNTPEDSRIATRKPGLVWFWSGREAGGYPAGNSKEEIWQKLKDFDYILLDNFPFFPEKMNHVMPFLKAFSDSFTVLHTTKKPENYVIRPNHGRYTGPALSVAELFRKGIKARDAGDLDGAVTPLEEAVRLSPRSVELVNSLAVTYTMRGDIEKARALLEILVKTAPKRADFRTNLAVVLTNMGNYERARSECRTILDSDSTYAQAYGVIGETYQRQGDLPMALSWYRQAYSMDPTDATIIKYVEDLEAILGPPTD